MTLFKIASWKEIENRRKFFEDYATENHFDSQDANQWYKQPREKIMAAKV